MWLKGKASTISGKSELTWRQQPEKSTVHSPVNSDWMSIPVEWHSQLDSWLWLFNQSYTCKQMRRPETEINVNRLKWRTPIYIKAWLWRCGYTRLCCSFVFWHRPAKHKFPISLSCVGSLSMWLFLILILIKCTLKIIKRWGREEDRIVAVNHLNIMELNCQLIMKSWNHWKW